MDIRLGVDTYSIRGFRWKAFRQVDYAGRLKLDAVQIRQADFESLDEAYLRKLKAYADGFGILLEPGFGCICPLSERWNGKRQGTPQKYLLEVIRVTRTLGAGAAKVFMGYGGDRGGRHPIPAMMEATINALASVRSQALDAGVKIAIENHGDLRAAEARTIIEEAGQDFVGACLDSGNPVRLLEDPLMALEILGPYTVTTHIRDSALWEHPRGAVVQSVALGDGSIDFPRFVARFRELCPKAPFLLEIITGGRPWVVPYLEPEIWKQFPTTPAAEFARFVALVKRGRPFSGGMFIGGAGKQPPEYEAALREQQRVDLEQSLDYAKKTLGVGVRWRV